MKFAVITLPYSVDGWDKGTEAGPEALLQAGLTDWLHEQGHEVAGPYHVELTPKEQTAYGAWNKIGLANAHLLPDWSRKQRRHGLSHWFWKAIVTAPSVS